MATTNPYDKVAAELTVDGKAYKYYSLPALNDDRVAKLPFSVRVLLECAVRNCDGFSVTERNVADILDWANTNTKGLEIPFKPARVILQDFTGVPAVVDLAAMRAAMKRLGGDPDKISPQVPVDLVIDHSVQVDVTRTDDAVKRNQEIEFQRNKERFTFLKWGKSAFDNLSIVPPGQGIVHQVNLEYLARAVFDQDGLLYPDSLVGTDSHTTMINGLAITGWGVGGIEAESVMLGQPITMVLPQVVGFKLTGKLSQTATATDMVLTVVMMLRKKGVVGKFVEFYGPGMATLSIADRATLANMAPEYGATQGFCPADGKTIEFLRQTGRSEERVKVIETYLKTQGLFADFTDEAAAPSFTDTLELDLSTVEASLAGPKRPHDHVAMSTMKSDFEASLTNKVGFKGFGLSEEAVAAKTPFTYQGKDYEMTHGDVVLAAITSCTNTSNPSVMLGAGLVAKKAVEAGLTTRPYIKTSLSPGSGVVTQYLEKSGLQPFLDQLGFNTVAYGCCTCIGSSGDLYPEVAEAIPKDDLVVAGVLSGNRNFEGRIHALIRANYLASPPLVVAYAIAGTTRIDFEKEPIGTSSKTGKPVFLRDIWPSSDEVQEIVNQNVLPAMFKDVYAAAQKGDANWESLKAPEGKIYSWPESTYINEPPFFTTMGTDVGPLPVIKDAYCLLNLGDSITTDHASPAGNIARSSPAARWLMERGVEAKDFNSYGSRRGNDLIMVRGTFANVRLLNKFIGHAAPKTVHHPSGETLDVFDAAMKYKEADQPTIILAGAEYGSGSSRDWAAKGVMLQGVKAVIAISYERIHRSNLVGMGVVPLQFKEGENAESLGLTGKEQFSIELTEPVTPGMDITVKVSDGRSFVTKLRADALIEIEYLKHGGILQYVLRKLLKA